MINAVAIDDEQAAIDILKKHAEITESLNLLRTFLNPIEAVEYINSNKVDLVLLDINMPDIKGVDIPEMLIGSPAVIFTTAYTEYAVRSYELNAIDYLIKPINYTRFYTAIQKFEKQRKKTKNENSKVLFVKSGVEYIRIEISDILYIEADGVYVNIITTKNATGFLCRTSLANILDNLSSQFIQIHRSYVVNYSTITKIKHNHIYLGNVNIPISKTHRSNLFNLISDKKIGF